MDTCWSAGYQFEMAQRARSRSEGALMLLISTRGHKIANAQLRLTLGIWTGPQSRSAR